MNANSIYGLNTKFLNTIKQASYEEITQFNQNYVKQNIVKPISIAMAGFYDYLKQGIIHGDIDSLNQASNYSLDNFSFLHNQRLFSIFTLLFRSPILKSYIVFFCQKIS